MKKLRVLIVEDDPQKLRPLLDRLSNSAFDPDVRNTADDALKRVQTTTFDVIFIDLQLTKEEEGKEPFYEGIALGEQVRKLAPDAAMVMYSGSIAKGQEKVSPHYFECMEVLKADAVLARSELFSISAQLLESRIQEWLGTRRRLSAGVHVDFATDLRTNAAVEVFGPVLQRLIASCAKNMNYFKVTALQAGYSGAAVLRVVASQSSDFTAASRLIVKVSNSRDGLVDELHRLPMVGTHYEAASVLPSAQEPVECDGLHAIAIREVREMMLLRDFLLKPGISSPERAIISRVVQHLLVTPAKEAKSWDNYDISSGTHRLRAIAASEITDFLEEATKWKAILKAPDMRALKATKDFVDLVLKGVWSFPVQGRLAALLHGDLHCRNLFVAEDDAPVLIDFGRSGVYPRLFDFAALDADIVLSITDCNKGEDQQLANVENWFKTITASFPFTTTNSVMPKVTTKAACLRQKLLIEMLDKIPSVVPTEYAETLVFQYLRYLRFANISLPKKLLATRLIETLTKKFGMTQVGRKRPTTHLVDS